MAITTTRVLDPDGPIPYGRFAQEIWQLTGDGSATTVTITAQWLGTLVSAVGTQANDCVLSTNTAALTFGTAPGNGKIVYITLTGYAR